MSRSSTSSRSGVPSRSQVSSRAKGILSGENPPLQPAATGAINTQPQQADLVSSAYSEPDGDPHLSTDWQVRGQGDTDWSAPVFESIGNTSDLESITATGLTSDTNYEYRVRHTDTDGASAWSQPEPFSTDPAGAPVVETLTIVEVETSDPDAEFDVEWAVSDPDGDLDRVEFQLWNMTEDVEENFAQFDISGGSADNGDTPYRFVANNKDGSGDMFEMRMDVFDNAGNGVRGTAQITETEIAQPPVVDTLAVSEAETDDPDAEFDVSWQVSDPNGDLGNVFLTLTDDTDVETEHQASIDVSGESASATTRLFAIGDDGSGNSYTVQAEVVDADDQADTQTTSITEGEVTADPYLEASISYTDAQSQWNSIGADSGALVLQQEPRHYGMYDWLKTLSVSDVAINDLGAPSYTPGSGASNDEVYSAWVAFRNVSGSSPIPDLLTYPDEDFVLDDGSGNGFEADPNVGVRISLEDVQVRKAVTAQAAWWTDFNLPGLDNPYYENDNTKRKVCAQALVDLMEHERDVRNEGNISHAYTNLSGMAVRDNIQAIAHAGDVLPDHVKYAAVEQAYWLLDQVQGNFNWPWINENMSSKAMCGLLVCWRLMEDLGMDASQQDNVVNIVRDALYDDDAIDSTTPNDDTYGRHGNTGSSAFVEGLVRPDGGWIENGGASATYNGISMHYCVEGYGYVRHWSEWDFFGEMTKRFFVRGQIEGVQDYDEGVPRPSISAPSMYSNRELAPITDDQSPNAGKYMLAAQFWGEDVFPWVGDLYPQNIPNSAVPPSISQMESTLQDHVDARFGSHESVLREWSLESRWGPRHGGIGWSHYEIGTYDMIQQAHQNNNVHLTIPQNRDGNTYTRLKSDMLIHKGIHNGTEWGCEVEAALWPGIWTRGNQNLNTFWVKPIGPLVQNMSPKSSLDAPSRPFIEFQLILSDGSTPEYHKWHFGQTIPVESQSSGEDWIEQEMLKAGVINRTRVNVLSGGVEMVNELRPDGSSFEWTDCVYVLPIFRGRGFYVWDESTSSPVWDEWVGPRTRIDYWTGSGWSIPTTGEQTTQYIRLSRDFEPDNDDPTRVYAYMVLDQQRTVSLVQSQDYQQRHPWGRSYWHRDLQIVVHPDPGTPQTINSATDFTYTLQVDDPTA